VHFILQKGPTVSECVSVSVSV